MATDPVRTYIVECPSCNQKYALNGVTFQDDEELACQQCKAIFRVTIDGGRVGTTLVLPPTGSPWGPAEGPRLERQ